MTWYLLECAHYGERSRLVPNIAGDRIQCEVCDTKRRIVAKFQPPAQFVSTDI